MAIGEFMGIIAAVMIGGGLLAVALYALFWGDLQIKRGLLTEDRLPLWWFAAAGIPPVIGGLCVWVALY